MFLFLFLLSTLFAAKPGADIALILDNSCSMITNPGMDKERSALLGAMVIEGLMRGSSQDHLQIYAMPGITDVPKMPNAKAIKISTYEELRSLDYGNTFFNDQLKQSHAQLTNSKKNSKVLLLFTDGQPTNLVKEEQHPYLHSIYDTKTINYSTFAVGLHKKGIDTEAQRQFLNGLMVHPDKDLIMTDDPSALVPFFIEGFAKAIGSKPETGSISSNKKFTVGKYVTQIFVVVSSHDPGPPFDVKLKGEGAVHTPSAKGNNGCDYDYIVEDPPGLCDDPRRHFVTYRVNHDPLTMGDYEIQTDGKQTLDYGIIYRYDLHAQIQNTNCSVEVGDTLKIKANMTFRDKIFNEEVFFSQDNFTSEFMIDGQVVPMNHTGGGIFEANWIPTNPMDQVFGTVVFKNDWLQIKENIECTVTGTLDLNIIATPIDLGEWDGDGIEVTKCGIIDASSTEYLELIDTQCDVEGLPMGFKGSCEPITDPPLEKGKYPTKWEFCITSPPCCSESLGPANVWLRPKVDRYQDRAAQVNVAYTVNETTFWNCWRYWIMTGIALLLLLLFIYGLISPHEFDDGLTITFDDSFKSLKKADSWFVEEQPKGKKGFYRNARVAIKDYSFTSKYKTAQLALEAQKNGKIAVLRGSDIKKYHNSNKTWKSIEEEELKEIGLERDEIYKTNDLYFKLE